MQIAVVLAAALLVAAGARADGDPASDVLPSADVFLPYPAPHKEVAAALETLVASANTGANRLTLAVVATRIDLGAIPSLYGPRAAVHGHARADRGRAGRACAAGRNPKLEYAVDDDSGEAAVTVRVVGGTTIHRHLQVVNPSVLYSVRWRVPATASAKVRYCVTARDASGNTSKPACATISIAPPSA